MNTFLNALKNELLVSGFSSKEVEEILKDYEEMISQAMRQGLSEHFDRRHVWNREANC